VEDDAEKYESTVLTVEMVSAFQLIGNVAVADVPIPLKS
jgi:hypothetical protein